MPTQLTSEQNREAREYLARQAGESVVVGNAGKIEVLRPNEKINISEMPDKELLEFLQCRDTLNREFSVMSEDEYKAVPASVRQFADNVAFELIVEKHIINNKADLDMAPYLVAPFVTQSIIEGLKESGFTAKRASGETVTHGDIRAVMTDIFRDYNVSDTLDETVAAVKKQFSEAGLTFIMPENHIEPEPEQEIKVEVKPEPMPEVKAEFKLELPTEVKVEAKPELPDLPTSIKVDDEPEVKAEVTNLKGEVQLTGNTPFIVIPPSQQNNKVLNLAISGALKKTSLEPLDVRSKAIAETLAEFSVYMSSSTEILSTLPKNELVEESAANIMSPLEDVEFAATLSDKPLSDLVLASKLVKAIKEQDAQPTIDAESPNMYLFTAEDAPKNKVKAPDVEPEENVMHMKRKTY
jgi:hypothetical protein